MSGARRIVVVEGGPAPDAMAGFTLIELMVVVVIVGILAAVGLPFYQGYVLSGNLNAAVPHLMMISSKQQIYYNRTGRFLATFNEQDLADKLGVDLSQVGDFCFMTFCTSSSQCGNASGASATTGSYISTSNTPSYQVIGVLRLRLSDGSGSSTVSGAGSTCTVGTSPTKLSPSGWVRASGAGGEGRVVALSYPPPADGRAASSTTIGGHAVTLDWRQSVTLSDAQVP
jgi:prepilin-type N-terminal cleavage/methylation domain-containing protein